MKRGKRQVQQRAGNQSQYLEVYQNQNEQQDISTESSKKSQFANFYQNGFNNFQRSKTNDSVEMQHQREQPNMSQNYTVDTHNKNIVPSPKTQTTAENNSVILQKANTIRQVQGQADQKKRKIQLLKQKYLKKNITQKKQQETIVKVIQTHKIQSPTTIFEQLKQKQLKNVEKRSQIKLQRQVQSSTQSKNIQFGIQKLKQASLKQATQTNQIKKEKQTFAQKQLFKQAQKLQAQENNTLVDKESANMQKKNGVQTINNTNIINNRVPPAPVIKKNVPPPPPNSGNKAISSVINKRFNKQLNRQQKPQSFRLPDAFDDLQNQQKTMNKQQKSQQKNIQVDQEHSESKQQQTNLNQQKIQKKTQVIGLKTNSIQEEEDQFGMNIEQALKCWIQNPQEALKTIYPNQKQLIQYFFYSKFLRPELNSKNPSFSHILSKIVAAFIIHNENPFNQQQKKIIQEIFITFFYSNPKQLDDIFLVGLIKMGQNAILKYKQILKEKFQFYLQRLILFKNLFLQEQISKFIQICLSPYFFHQKHFAYLFMLSPQNQKLIQKLQGFDFQNEKVMLSLLVLCRVNLKDKNIVGLYLRLLLNLTELFSRYQFAQTVLSHLKQIQIPESLYQLSKQVKLKLLKNYEQTQRKQENYQKNAKDGLFKYFNKAIDKIKNTTTATVNNTTQKPIVKEQQSKDKIVYDPVLKRYVINGVVPQDQHQKKKFGNDCQQQKKVPPPPPSVRKTQPPPPPSLPGRKGGSRLANKYT